MRILLPDSLHSWVNFQGLIFGGEITVHKMNYADLFFVVGPCLYSSNGAYMVMALKKAREFPGNQVISIIPDLVL